MARSQQDIEVIVRYEPNMECQVRALLIMLGEGKGQPPAEEGTAEERGQSDAQTQRRP